VECQAVRALRNLNQNRIVSAVLGIVFGQLHAEASGLYANGGITLWIESGRPPQYLGGDLVFLQSNAGVIEGVFGEVAQ
jgi:hypothetical protein